MRSPRLEFLTSIRVLELGRTVSTAASGCLLQQLGAEVTALRYGDGPPALEALPPIPNGGGPGYLARFLDEGKSMSHWRAGQSLAELILPFDVVVCDVDADLPAPLRSPSRDAYVATIETVNQRVWISICPFGLTGPYRDYRASELVMQAAGGVLAYVRSPGNGQPVKLAGRQAELLTGEVAAVAALHAVDRFRAERRPVHFEVSAQEAVLATSVRLQCEALLLGAQRRSSVERPGLRIFPCRDGEVMILIMEDRHWTALVEAMGNPSWAGSIRSAQDRLDNAASIADHVSAWTRQSGKHECTAVLQSLGVPVSPVNSPAELLESPQFSSRSFFTDQPLRKWPQPPLEIESYGHAVGDQRRPGSITSLRVLDCSQVLGPPLATSFVGAMGAEVIKVEDASRPDVYRRAGAEQSLDASPAFVSANHSKKSIALDLESEPGKDVLTHLLEHSDVVVENTTASRRARLGLSPARFLEDTPGRLFLSSSGWGRSGPYGTFRAFGQNIGAYAGLTDLTRAPDGQPAHTVIAWADLATAVYLAALMAAFGLSDRSTSLWLELSMAELAARHLAEFILAAANGSAPDRARGNDTFASAPHGVYSCADDRLLALAVFSDREWHALKHVLHDPPELGATMFRSVECRYKHRSQLDALLAVLLRTQDADELFTTLQTAGVAASPLWDAAALVQNEHLAARNFFVNRELPGVGSRRGVGLPWRPAAGGPLPLGPTPLVGQHNEELSIPVVTPTRRPPR